MMPFFYKLIALAVSQLEKRKLEGNGIFKSIRKKHLKRYARVRQ